MKKNYSYVVVLHYTRREGCNICIQGVFSSLRSASACAWSLRTNFSQLLHQAERNNFENGGHDRFPSIVVRRYVTNASVFSARFPSSETVYSFVVSETNVSSGYKYTYLQI